MLEFDDFFAHFVRNTVFVLDIALLLRVILAGCMGLFHELIHLIDKML